MSKMSERDYSICIGKILAGKTLGEDEAQRFVEILSYFESMLDDADMQDFFGTEGWRHYMGWD